MHHPTNLQLDLNIPQTQLPAQFHNEFTSSIDRLNTSENIYAHRVPKNLVRTEENKLFIKLRDLRDELAKELPRKAMPSSYALKVLSFKTIEIFKSNDDEYLTDYRQTSDAEKLQTLLHYSQLSLEFNAYKDIYGKTLEESFSSNTRFTAEQARDFIWGCVLKLGGQQERG